MIDEDEMDYRITTNNYSGIKFIEIVPDAETPLTEVSLQSALDICERDLEIMCGNPDHKPRIPYTVENPNKKYLTKWKMIHGMISQLCLGRPLSDKQSAWMGTNYIGGVRKLLDDMETEENAAKLLTICETKIILCS